jgi:uncharacterized membrane protein
MNAHYLEWLNLTVRWIHMTIGIAWIGASFYFNWLENNLNRIHNLREEIKGDLWALHGGGFYYLEKYKVGPQVLPDDLHWFKYEAYFTWVSGMVLLALVFYLQPSAYLLDPAVSSIGPAAGIGIGLGTLVIGWFVYDFLCKTPLVEMGVYFAAFGMALISAVAYVLTHLLSGRAAYLHVGAMIGTIMAANVFMVIIPSQKILVDTVASGKELDPRPGQNALRRSRHNNYFTLPVLFVMLSGHFPSTYSNPYSWLVLSAIFVLSAGVRHYFNIRKQNPASIWFIPFAIAGLAGLAVFTAPRSSGDLVDKYAETSTQELYGNALKVIQMRCQPCHSANPTDDLFRTAPNGIFFDTPEQIHALMDRIRVRAVELKTMPLINKTGITDQEREVLGAWIQRQGESK